MTVTSLTTLKAIELHTAVTADASEKVCRRCVVLYDSLGLLIQQTQSLVNSERNMAIIVRRSCCGCELRTGILLIGFFGLVGIVALPCFNLFGLSVYAY